MACLGQHTAYKSTSEPVASVVCGKQNLNHSSEANCSKVDPRKGTKEASSRQGGGRCMETFRQSDCYSDPAQTVTSSSRNSEVGSHKSGLNLNGTMRCHIAVPTHLGGTLQCHRG